MGKWFPDLNAGTEFLTQLLHCDLTSLPDAQTFAALTRTAAEENPGRDKVSEVVAKNHGVDVE